jgi:hypothetical protein
MSSSISLPLSLPLDDAALKPPLSAAAVVLFRLNETRSRTVCRKEYGVEKSASVVVAAAVVVVVVAVVVVFFPSHAANFDAIIRVGVVVVAVDSNANRTSSERTNVKYIVLRVGTSRIPAPAMVNEFVCMYKYVSKRETY